jgi:hypothetical protein
LFLLGCLGAIVMRSHQASVMEKLAPPGAESEARAYVDLLRTNQFDQIERGLDPGILDDSTHGQLVFMASLFPAQQPTSVKVVGLESRHDGNLTDRRTTLEYEFPGRWLLASLVTRSQNGTQTIIGFNVNELSDSLEHSNRFTFAGKGLEQYLILLMFLIDFGLTFYVLILCVKTGLNRKNWFWPIICLFGVARFAVNWTTGEVNFTAIWIGFPPAGANSTFFSPWTVYAAVPLGAILFLLFNRPQHHLGQAAPSSIPTDDPLQEAPPEQADSPSAGA